ncbi:DUF4145 domain-containing protein [Sulfurimonas hydrogeniphila]|uniref:DUF4145 domain-containing protein n=1 Tax=Sulfurimonas hydrogeniphila TaxID=2509341 RepID=UPI00125EEFE5|nr:DUF4145 domain-containing protein [Sulfurimonas hydrogeniphila]
MSSKLKYGEEKFVCPHCNALAKQDWFSKTMMSEIVDSIYIHNFLDYRGSIKDYQQSSIEKFLVHMKHELPKELNEYLPSSLSISKCQACDNFALWVKREVVYPKINFTTPPNLDMDKDIQDLYNEASKILFDSPKGAAAILRLALQKLLLQLGETDKKIDRNIKSLVEKGLSPKIQKALDFVRVVGNEAVHPGEINLDDNKDIALTLFKILNLIANDMITIPKEMDELYENIIPDDKKKQIDQRDGR